MPHIKAVTCAQTPALARTCGALGAIVLVLFCLLLSFQARADSGWQPASQTAIPPPSRSDWRDLNARMQAIVTDPSSKRLIAVGKSGTILVSDAQDPTKAWTRVAGTPHARLTAIAAQPDGKRLIAVGSNGTILVSDAQDPTKPWTKVPGTPNADLTAIAAHPDGKRLIAVGWAGTILVSDARDPTRPWTQVAGTPPDTGLTAIAAHPDGKRLIAVGDDGTILICNAQDPTKPWTKVASGSDADLAAIAAHPDGKRLIAVSNGTILVSDAQDPTKPWTKVPGTPNANLTAIAAHPDSKHLIAIGDNGTILVSDAQDPTKPWTKVAFTQNANLTAIAAHPDSKRLIAVSTNGTILISDAQDPTKPWTKVTGTPDEYLTAIAAHPDSKRLIAVGANGTILVSDSQDPTKPWTRVAGTPNAVLTAIAAHPDNTRLIAVGPRGTILIGDAHNPTKPWTRVAGAPPDAVLAAIVAHPDGKRLIAVGENGTILVSDGQDPTKPWTQVAGTPPDAFLTAIAAHPDSKRLIAVGDDGMILVSDALEPTWAWTQVPDTPDARLTAIAAYPDGKHLIAIGDNGTILVSDAQDPTKPWTKVAFTPDASLAAIAAHPDGKRLIAVGGNGTILVSDAQDPTKPWTKVTGTPDEYLTAIAAHPHSKHLIAIGDNGTILVSDTQDATKPWTKVPGTPDASLTAIAAHPDGKRLIAVGSSVVMESDDDGENWTSSQFSPEWNVRTTSIFALFESGTLSFALNSPGSGNLVFLKAAFDTASQQRPTVQTASPAISYRYEITNESAGNGRSRATSVVEWKYPEGSDVSCNAVRFLEKQPDEPLPFAHQWPNADGHITKLEGASTPPGFTLRWQPKQTLASGTPIYYAVDCKDNAADITWLQRLDTPQRWVPDPLWDKIIDWMRDRTTEQWVAIGAIALVGTWFLFVALVWIVQPAILAGLYDRFPSQQEWDAAAQPLEKVTFGAIGIVGLALRALTLFLGTSARSLDAWVAKRADEARANFSALRTVQDRTVVVDLPVLADGKRVDTPWNVVGNLLKGRKPVVIYVSGPGGGGKTTLACRIARRGLGDLERPPIGHARMLPLLVESDLPMTNDKDPKAMPAAEHLAGLLRVAVNAPRPLSTHLTAALLRAGRLLVVVDGLSERSEATRNAFDPKRKDFQINRMIVTGRGETFEGATSAIRTETIPSGALFDFIDRYLTEMQANGVATRPADPEIHAACAELARLLDGEPCTPMLASMWARELAHAAPGNLPKGVAELKDSYVRRLLRPASAGSEVLLNRLIQDATKIAEIELGDQYRPGHVTRAAALDALKALDPNASDDRLRKLAESRLLESPSTDSDLVAIVPDPIAEHLVARTLTEQLAGNTNPWRAQLAKLRRANNPPGFIAALKHCLAHPVYGRQVPALVRTQIDDLSKGQDQAA